MSSRVKIALASSFLLDFEKKKVKVYRSNRKTRVVHLLARGVSMNAGFCCFAKEGIK